MAIKKKEIIETKEAVQLPKVEKVRPDYAHLQLAPTYATTCYLADSFNYTKCYQVATAHYGMTPIWQEPQELWEAYAIYSAWCEATPVITMEAVKSGMARRSLPPLRSSRPPAARASISPPSARTAARKPRFRSSPRPIVRSTAASASPRSGSSRPTPESPDYNNDWDARRRPFRFFFVVCSRIFNLFNANYIYRR